MDLSLVAPAFSAMRLDPPSKLSLLNAPELSPLHFPPHPPDSAALILGVHSSELALEVQRVMRAIYPEDHPIYWIDQDLAREERLASLGSGGYSSSTCVYVPPLPEGSSFEAFAEIVAHLRAPDGCPWDREQTHQSLRKHLLEESYEALSAIDARDVDGMREEFGDLLLQIVLNAQIAWESKEFSMHEIVYGIYEKIVRRHPHVFGDLKLDGVESVLQNWEKIKEKERGKKMVEKGLLDGVPAILPALNQAQEYQDRAARVGFDWPEIGDVLDKVREEIEEIKQAQNMDEVAAELGDLFFVLVNLARWKKVDAESVLRGANAKFKKRFGFVEKTARQQGKNLSDMTLDEMDLLWDQAKENGM